MIALTIEVIRLCTQGVAVQQAHLTIDPDRGQGVVRSVHERRGLRERDVRGRHLQAPRSLRAVIRPGAAPQPDLKPLKRWGAMFPRG